MADLRGNDGRGGELVNAGGGEGGEDGQRSEGAGGRSPTPHLLGGEDRLRLKQFTLLNYFPIKKLFQIMKSALPY